MLGRTINAAGCSRQLGFLAACCTSQICTVQHVHHELWRDAREGELSVAAMGTLALAG